MRGSGWDSLHPQSEYFDKTAQIKGSTLIIFYFHISALQATETMVRTASLPTGAYNYWSELFWIQFWSIYCSRNG